MNSCSGGERWGGGGVQHSAGTGTLTTYICCEPGTRSSVTQWHRRRRRRRRCSCSPAVTMALTVMLSQLPLMMMQQLQVTLILVKMTDLTPLLLLFLLSAAVGVGSTGMLPTADTDPRPVGRRRRSVSVAGRTVTTGSRSAWRPSAAAAAAAAGRPGRRAARASSVPVRSTPGRCDAGSPIQAINRPSRHRCGRLRHRFRYRRRRRSGHGCRAAIGLVTVHRRWSCQRQARGA